jgi:uncharacterized membrane protein YozB (DUF420 family)
MAPRIANTIPGPSIFLSPFDMLLAASSLPKQGGRLRSKLENRIAVSIIICFYVLLSTVFLFYAASPWLDHMVIPFTKSRTNDTVIFGSIGVFYLFIAIEFLRRKRWAWRVALVTSVLIFALCLWLLFLVIYPRDEFAREEGGYAFYLSMLFGIPAAICTALISLPPVRGRFKEST